MTRTSVSQLYSFHNFLLHDTARLEAFRRAIHAEVRPGDVVLDLGAGSGILSLFACEAGAARVYAVEGGPSITMALMAARHNGYANRIECIKGLSTEIELPEKVDVVVGDVFEIFGLDQGILAAMRDAGVRLLAEGGRFMPRALDLWAAPLEDAETHDRHIASWSSLEYGYASLRTQAASLRYAHRARERQLLCAPARITQIVIDADVSLAAGGTVEFIASRAGTVHGFAGWFSAELSDGIWVSNRPESDSCAYLLAYLPIDQPIEVVAGTPITLDVRSWNGEQWHWAAQVGDTRVDQSTLYAIPMDDELAGVRRFDRGSARAPGQPQGPGLPTQ